MEKWLVREELGGSYKEILSEVHRSDLNRCHTVTSAIKELSVSPSWPIPYHPIHIGISKNDGRIHSYTPMYCDWKNLRDIPTLASIAGEIRIVTVDVKEQEQPTPASLNKARSIALGQRCFFTKNTSKTEQDVSEILTFETGVRPTCLLVREQHNGKEFTQCLSAKNFSGTMLHMQLERGTN